jgi:type I restriction enzyme S subunit
MILQRYPAYKDSGIGWLGRIPASWSVDKFRYVFTESNEINGPSPVGEMLSISGYRGVEIKHYDDENQKRSESQLESYRVVRKGQLAVNTMWLNHAGLGVSTLTGHVSPAYRSYWIRPDMNHRYVHHLMRSSIYVDGYTALLSGIRPNSLQMSRPDLMAFPILVPPTEDQRIIADFLDHETAEIDAFIADQERLIELLEERRAATISQIVTKGLDSKAPMHDRGVEWLGAVPSHWVVQPATAMCQILTSTVDKKSYEGEKPVRLCNYTDVYYNDTLHDDPTYMKATATSSQIALFTPKTGDVAITKDSESSDDIGIAAYVPMDMPGVVFGYHLAIYRPKQKSYGKFLKYLFDSKYVKTTFEVNTPGVTRVGLGQNTLKYLRIPTPPVQEAVAIADYLERETSHIDSAIIDARDAIALSRERRAALISAAVTGQINVSQAQRPETEARKDEVRV